MDTLANARKASGTSASRAVSIIIFAIGAIYAVMGVVMLFDPSLWFFHLVPGVPETGPFNAHLVADAGTFFIAIGIGLLIAAGNPLRHVSAIVVAAVAGLLHAGLHIVSHADGALSLDHLTTETVGIYLPTIALIVIAASRGRTQTWSGTTAKQEINRHENKTA